MNSILVTAPVALAISVLLGNNLLTYLGLRDHLLWLVPIAFFATVALYQRKLLDLFLVGCLSALATPAADSATRFGIAPEVLLCLAIGLTLLPQLMSAMGLEYTRVVKNTP